MTTILNAGIYDMLHKGHLNLLRAMKKRGDELIIVVHDDVSTFKIKDKFPVQDLPTRIHNLLSTGLVDGIIITRDEDPSLEFEKVILKKSEVIYMRGDDLRDFPGKHMLDYYDVEIEFLPYTKGISSSELRDKIAK